MRFVLWITGLFALAVLLGLASTLNNGYAILFFPPYRMEVSFNLMIVGVLVLIAVAYGILRLIGVAANMPTEVRAFQRQKKLKAARHALREAGIAFFEGRFQKAEREAARAIDDEYAPENRALALLIAARSAGMMQNFDKRDAYLARLDTVPERLQLARHMVDAELRLEAKDLLGALAAIERARAVAPNLTNALRLELKVRILQKQPDAVLALTEKLLKADALEPEQARRYRMAAYCQQLEGLPSGEAIRNWWRRIPEVERQNPDLVRPTVERLEDLGDFDQAAQLIGAALVSDDTTLPELALGLARLAEHVSGEKRLALLREAEAWLQVRPRDHLLLFALGRLAAEEHLWGKAQSYLEASLSLEPTLMAHAALARLYEAIGKPEEAEHHYQRSLALALERGA